jgi:predicted nucleic acid-binding protein
VSLWAKTEFASLLARKVRMGESTADFADEVLAKFEKMMRESCQVIVPSATDFDQATRYLQHYQGGLRAGDALHLAIAYNQRTQSMLTLDKDLARAAALLGISVDLGV